MFEINRRKLLKKGSAVVGTGSVADIGSASPDRRYKNRWEVDIEPQIPQKRLSYDGKIKIDDREFEGRFDTKQAIPEIVDYVLVTVKDNKKGTNHHFIGSIKDSNLRYSNISDTEYTSMKQGDIVGADLLSDPGRLPESPEWVNDWDAYIYQTGDPCSAYDGYNELKHLMTGATIDATKPLASIGGPAVGAAIGTLFGSVVGPEGSAIGNVVGSMIGALVGALIAAGWSTRKATFAFVDQDIGYIVEKAAIRAQYSGYYNERSPNDMIPTGVYPGNHLIP